MTAVRGVTSLAEEARLTGGFADWHNLIYRVMWITGPLNPAAVGDAWRRVCRRHDALRRTFVSPDEAFTHDDALNEVQFFASSTDDEALALMRDFLSPPFCLDGPSFARVAVVQCGEQRFLFGIALDHIIGDLISWRRIRADLTETYARALAGDDRDLPGEGSYREFAAAQRRLLAGSWGEERRAFWRAYIDEFGPYPPSSPSPTTLAAGYRPQVVTRDLPADARARVRAESRRTRVSPFAMIATGVLVGVHEITGDHRAGILLNHHGRGLPGTSQTVGLFAETVPLHLGAGKTSRPELIREVLHRTFDVFEYALPLGVAERTWKEALTAAGPTSGGLHLEFQEQPMSTLVAPLFHGLGTDHVGLTLPGDKVWTETVVVSWNLYDTDPRIVVEYNADHVPESAVTALIDTAEAFVCPVGDSR